MPIKVSLKEIASVHAGYLFREAIQPSLTGAVAVLQAKDVESDEPIVETSTFSVISQAPVRTEAYLQKNDVVLVARAAGPGGFRSTVFRTSGMRVVASASILIVRLKSLLIIPEYLALYLNSVQGQRQLGEDLSGATIKAIPRQALEDLEISLPSLEVQKQIVALHDIIRKKEHLYFRKIQIERSMLNYLLQSDNLK